MRQIFVEWANVVVLNEAAEIAVADESSPSQCWRPRRRKASMGFTLWWKAGWLLRARPNCPARLYPDKRLNSLASQFNLLEMTGPSVTPEDGVTRYKDDPTQGPACAIAAGAATILHRH
jgi:hypothetical protein